MELTSVGDGSEPGSGVLTRKEFADQRLLAFAGVGVVARVSKRSDSREVLSEDVRLRVC